MRSGFLHWSEAKGEALLDLLDEHRSLFQEKSSRNIAFATLATLLQKRFPELQQIEHLERKVERRLRYLNDKRGGEGTLVERVFLEGGSAFRKPQPGQEVAARTQATLDSEGSLSTVAESPPILDDLQDQSLTSSNRRTSASESSCVVDGPAANTLIPVYAGDPKQSIRLRKDSYEQESHNIEEWARAQLSQVNPVSLDDIRDRLENLKEKIEQAAMLLLQGIDLEFEHLANLEFDSSSNSDTKALTLLVFGAPSDTSIASDWRSLRRLAKTGCLRLTDILRSYIAAAMYHWIFSTNLAEKHASRNVQDKYMLDKIERIGPQVRKALGLAARQNYLDREVWPQIGGRAKAYADRIDSSLTSLAHAIGARCRPFGEEGLPASYNEVSWVHDWEKQLNSMFTDALQVAIELEGCSDLNKRTYIFRWPIHDEIYDPAWIQHSPQPPQHSYRILLPLFPALYRRRETEDKLLLPASAVPYRQCDNGQSETLHA